MTLEDLFPRPNWWHHGACLGANPDQFFPQQGASHADIDAAKAICATCPVRKPCLEDAIATNERFGIRGGMTVLERRREITRRRRDAAA